MNNETIEMLINFEKNITKNNLILKEKYKSFLEDYDLYLSEYFGGCGMIGENSYLHLWSKEEIEELNNDFEVEEFLTDVMLIGSDGGDTAYGINSKHEFIEVPFIGMDHDEITVIAETFDEFIKYLFFK